MSVWWSDNPERLRAERAAIESLSERKEWLTDVEWSFDNLFRMQMVFEIKLPHQSFPLRLIYHNTFPDTCPSVRPQDPDRLSGHQYGNGDLCLEIRPDNWVPEFTGADLIESAYKLLSIEQPADDGTVTAAPSAHNVPDTIASRNAVSRLYLSPNQLKLLESDSPDVFAGKLWVQWCGESFVVAHLSQGSMGDWAWIDETLPSALNKEAASHSCVVAKTNVPQKKLNGIATKEQLFDALGTDLSLDNPSFYCLICPKDGMPILYRQIKDLDGLIKYRTVLAPEEESSRNGDIAETLGSVRIGIVGLGSLGSKIAVSLARSGVRHFDLIDDDVVHAGNLERHDCDWRDVGLHKVDAVARRIKLVSKSCVVSARRVSIGAQVSPTEMATVNGALKECDVVIDATASPTVLNHLAAITMRSGKPLVWGGIYAGGIGGYMARSREEVEPTPQSIRQALNEYYEGIDEPPPVFAGQGYDGQSVDEVYVATDSEVTLMAAHMSSLVLDTLLNGTISEFDYPLYLIGFKRAWVFRSPFHVQPVSIDAPIRMPRALETKDSNHDDFVGDLVKKKLDEITNQSEDA